MFAPLETGFGLDVVVWLQAHGGPFFDLLAQFLDFLGSDLAYLILLPFIYWSVNRRLGRRLFLVLIVTLFAVTTLKGIFASPRPYQAAPDQVRVIVEEPGYGIPSGHVALSLVLWGFIIWWYKRPRLWWVLALYALLMAWGRMYGGVHYPQDALGGALAGLAVLWWGIYSIDLPIRLWNRITLSVRLGFVALAGLLTFILLYDTDTGPVVAGFILGGGGGLMLEEYAIRFSSGGRWRQRWLRFVGGVLLLLILFFGLRILFGEHEPRVVLRTLRYGLISFVLVAGWPWLSIRLGLAERFLRDGLPPDEARADA